MAVGLLQGARELAGHGQQAGLFLADGAGFALQARVFVVGADQGGEGLAGAVDQLQGAVKAGLGGAQLGFGAAGDGLGELVVQARQRGVQVAQLVGVDQAELLGASDLGQQGGPSRRHRPPSGGVVSGASRLWTCWASGGSW